MENLFDLLIILFIIYALLSPLFKKKPAPQKPFPKTEDQPTVRIPEREKTEQEILREIEELFGYTSTPEPEQEPKSETKVVFETKDEESFEIEEEYIPLPKYEEPKFEEKIKETLTVSDQKLHQDFFIKTYDYESTLIDVEIDEFDYSRLEVFDYAQSEKETEVEVKTFTISLSEPDDFKKAIIYKEIFDTPMALRMRKIKWQRNIY